jgi:hypothetical protein
LVNVRAVPVDISNDARVLEVSKGIVNKGAGGVGRMKNVVVHILGTRAVKIGRGEGACVKGEGIDNTAFVPGTHKSGLISDWLIGDVFGSLGLAKLINEDEWVVPKISGVKFFPAFARVVSVSEEGEGMVA